MVALMALAALAVAPSGGAAPLDLPMVLETDAHDHADDLADVQVAEIRAIDLGNVNVPEKCQTTDNHYPGGTWNTSCTGVRGGCVGSWHTYGTHDLNNKHVTTYSYSDTVCLYTITDLVGAPTATAAFGLPEVFAPVEMSFAAAPAIDADRVNVPEKCQNTDNHFVGGSWSSSCTGVRGGCVGSWYSSGTHDAQLRHVTTYSTSDTTCLSAVTDSVEEAVAKLVSTSAE